MRVPGTMRRVVPGLLMLALLAGCGGAGEHRAGSAPVATPTAQVSPAPRSTRPPSSAPSRRPNRAARPSSRPGTRDDLADLAEQQAAKAPATSSRGPVLGGDISWPQCPRGLGIPQRRTLGRPLPLDSARYVVIGLTNGPAFYANPCLGDQVDYVRARGLGAAAYAVASYPDAAALAAYGDRGPFDAGTRLGALQNTGYQQARFNLGSLQGAGLQTPIVWIDVESVPDFEWSSDPVANAAVVQGAARGYTDAGYSVGVYSTPYLWSQVVGDLSLGVPEWRAAGETSQAEAQRRCGADGVIQGGQPVLGQWVEDERDRDVTCPGIAGDLSRWFHQYGGRDN